MNKQGGGKNSSNQIFLLGNCAGPPVVLSICFPQQASELHYPRCHGMTGLTSANRLASPSPTLASPMNLSPSWLLHRKRHGLWMLGLGISPGALLLLSLPQGELQDDPLSRVKASLQWLRKLTRLSTWRQPQPPWNRGQPALPPPATRIVEGQGTDRSCLGHRVKELVCEGIFTAFPHSTSGLPTYFETYLSA